MYQYKNIRAARTNSFSALRLAFSTRIRISSALSSFTWCVILRAICGDMPGWFRERTSAETILRSSESFRDCKARAYLLMLGRVAPTILLLWQVLERPLVNQMHFRFGSDNIRRLLAEEAYKFLSLAVYRFETFICAETDYCHRKLAIRARKQKRMNVSRGHRRPSEI